MKEAFNEKSIAEILDGLGEMTEENEQDLDAAGEAEALMRLGAEFLKRLDIPEGMSAAEAVDAIISMWDEGGKAGEGAGYTERIRRENDPVTTAKLPKTLRGGLNELPEADYESMSAEQFRRLKKQLKRADMDGRRIRL